MAEEQIIIIKDGNAHVSFYEIQGYNSQACIIMHCTKLNGMTTQRKQHYRESDTCSQFR